MKSNFRTREAAIPTHIVFVVFYILLFAISLQYANAAASGSLVKLSNTNEASTDPQITASGNNVYVAWTDNSDIFFKKIAILSNGTLAYGDTVSLDDNNEASTDPQITASGNNVYVAWSTTTNNDILFAASTDNGSSFGLTVNLSNDTISSAGGKLFASGNNVYVAWTDNSEIFFKKITILSNGTLAYGDTVSLDDNNEASTDTQIAASGNNVYVAWSTLTNNEILFAASTDNGSSFGDTVNLSNDTISSAEGKLFASGNNVYVAWTDNSDIFFKKIAILSNGTLAYGDTVSLDDNNEASTDPQITASGNNVYVAWSTTTNNDILFAASTDNGSSFGLTVNLSNDTISSAGGKLFASGNNVYVAWTDNSDIFFKKITILSNGTLAYGDTVSLDDNNEASTDPQITASGNNVYVAWSTTTNNDILFAASTDNGSSFGNIVNVSNNSISSVEPRIVASGTKAYIVWQDDTEILFKKVTIDGDNNILGDAEDLSSSPNGSFHPSIAISPTTNVLTVTWEEFTNLDTGESDIFFRKITNSGTTFGDAINISHNVGNSVDSHVGIDEVTGNVFLIWTDDQGTTNNEIFSSASLNGGGNFGCPISISNSSENSLDARQALVDSDPIARQFVAMREVPLDLSRSDIFLQNSMDYLAKFIHIFPPSNLSPTWGSDSVSISGSVINPDVGDMAVVNWGDGNSDQTTVSGCSWGPIQHTYSVNAINSNPIQIVAKMVDNSGNQKAASDPVEVIVKPHTTSLALDKISTVKQGETITVTGSIIDESTGTPLGGKIITFDGTGALALPVSGVLSSSNGSFVAKAQAQNATAVGLSVMAHFAGDSSYAPSDGGPKTYATISSSAIAFSVKSGQNSNVILGGFNASIQFQNVLDNGTIFVANCDHTD